MLFVVGLEAIRSETALSPNSTTSTIALRYSMENIHKPPVHHSASIRPAHDTLKPGLNSALNLQESPRRCCTRRVLRATTTCTLFLHAGYIQPPD